MTTWTESARSTLEGHLARLRDGFATSGADPTEVADDLRRHIHEELAARQIGVVTTEDVESILQRIGLPAAAAPSGSARRRIRPPVSPRRAESRAARPPYPTIMPHGR